MNKSELVEKIANDVDISKASADRALSSAIAHIIKAIS
jgi:DNA-binding protein HU-beta